jgi:hypothetical protein
MVRHVRVALAGLAGVLALALLLLVEGAKRW